MSKYLGLLGKVVKEEEFSLLACKNTNDKSELFFAKKEKNISNIKFYPYDSNKSYSTQQPLKFKYGNFFFSANYSNLKLKVFDEESENWKDVIWEKTEKNTLSLFSIKTILDESNSIPDNLKLLRVQPQRKIGKHKEIYTGIWYKTFPNYNTRFSIHSNETANPYYSDLLFMFVPNKLFQSINNRCIEVKPKESIKFISQIMSGERSEPNVDNGKNIMWSLTHDISQEGEDCSKFIAYRYGDECKGKTYNTCDKGKCEYDKNEKSLKCLERSDSFFDDDFFNDDSFFDGDSTNRKPKKPKLPDVKDGIDLGYDNKTSTTINNVTTSEKVESSSNVLPNLILIGFLIYLAIGIYAYYKYFRKKKNKTVKEKLY